MQRARVPLNEYAPQRIVLIKPSALGDIVQSLPILTALRIRYPDAEIHWVVNQAYEPLLRGHPDLDATLPFDRAASRGGWRRAWAAYRDVAVRLRRGRFDLAIDLQGLLRTGLMTAATRAPQRAGLATGREGAVRFYTDVVAVPRAATSHAVDRYWLMVEALGAGGVPKRFRLPDFPGETAWATALLADYPRPWLVVGAGARWLTKRWLPEHFVALVRRSRERFGGTAILIGGAEEQAVSSAVAGRLPGPMFNITGRTTLPQLKAILAHADVMLANDTGPLHLAAALGRPVVAPYTCTRVERSGPYGAFGGAIETRVWCHGSYVKRCRRLECMAELTPERLWPALEEVLARWESRRRIA